MLLAPLQGLQDQHVQRSLQEFNTILITSPGLRHKDVDSLLPQAGARQEHLPGNLMGTAGGMLPYSISTGHRPDWEARMLTDLRDALRQLRKAPGFTTTALITLALGIGATTAIFTLVHQVMLKSLPVTSPSELWKIGDKDRCCNWGVYTQGNDGDFALFSYEAYQHFRAHTPEFIDLAALQAGNAPLAVRRVGARGPVDTRNGQFVSGNFFRTLGMQPWIGRLFTDEDDKESAAPVAVMSYRIWHDKYGSDPSVVGAGYQINGHPFTVIGVAPPGFFGAKLAEGSMPDFWLPLTTELIIDGPTARLKQPQTNFLDLLGRVRPGMNPKPLEAKLKVELHNWLASHVPDMDPG